MKKILITGDLFPSKSNERLFVDGDTDKLLGRDIEALFKNADISVCNLEGTLTYHNQKTTKLGPNIKAVPEVLNTYKKLGITLLATANNHVNDFCQQGYLDTQKSIKDYGFNAIGSGQNIDEIERYIVYTLDGVRICFYNVAETMFNIPTKTTAGVHLYDEYAVCTELEKLKFENHIVIVLYHGGVEYFPYPTIELRKRFHRMADSGADIILAQHTHCIGCEEYYNNSYLLYGQGNFLFDRYSTLDCTKHGLALKLTISDNGSYTIEKHYVTMSDGCIHLESNANLSDFQERSSHINDDEYLVGKFKEFVMTQKSVKTQQFRKRCWYDKILKRILPTSIYCIFEKKYREVHFTDAQLMRILYTVRSEQQRETALYMVYKELEDKNIKVL